MERVTKNRSFAVVGTYRGSGATLLCINFAAFLASYFAEEVAVVEVNSNGAFNKMAVSEESRQHVRKIENGFRIRNIFFFTDVSREYSAYLRSRRFGFFIYDMGTDFIRNEEIFLSCNQKIIVGSHLGWRITEYEQFLSYARTMLGYQQWEYVDMMAGRGRVCFIDDGRIKLKKLPFIEDALEYSDVTERVYHTFM